MLEIVFKTPTGILLPPYTYNIDLLMLLGGASSYNILSESFRESSMSSVALPVDSMFVSSEISEDLSECIMLSIALLEIS